MSTVKSAAVGEAVKIAEERGVIENLVPVSPAHLVATSHPSTPRDASSSKPSSLAVATPNRDDYL